MNNFWRLAVACLAVVAGSRGAGPGTPASAQPPAAAAHWTLATPLGANVTHLAATADGSLWARVRQGDAASERDGVVRWQGSPPRVSYRGTVRSGAALGGAVQAGAQTWPRNLSGFWSTDPDGRIWIGAKYFHRNKWTDLTARLASDLVNLAWRDEVALDGTGRAWVPFLQTRACPQPPDCSDAGLRAFGATGILTAGLTLEAVPEADAEGVPPVWLQSGDLSPNGELVGPFAAGRRAFYPLPDTAGSRYPPFDAALGTTLSSGYATAAARTAGDRSRVLVWIEERIRGVGIVERHRLYTWLGESWSAPDELDEAPIIKNGPGARLTAFARSPDGETLWVAGAGTGGAASGGVARRAGQVWDLSFAWDDVGFGAEKTDPEPVAQAMILDGDGRLWLASSAGLVVYGADNPEVVDLTAGTLYLPLTRRR